MNAWIAHLPPETREWAELLVEAKAYPSRGMPVVETSDCRVGMRGVVVTSPGTPPRIPAGLRVWWDDGMVTAVTHGTVIDLELPEGREAAQRVLERRGLQANADGILDEIFSEYLNGFDTLILPEPGRKERWRRLVLARTLLATADREPADVFQALDREAVVRGAAAMAFHAPSREEDFEEEP